MQPPAPTHDAVPVRASAPAPASGLPGSARRPVLVTAALLAAALLATATRYGYHRDELCFLAAGRHLAWGYPDQPPLTPAIARAVTALAGDSLLALRAPSALTAAAVVVLTALLARELGGGRSAQVLAAATMAVSNVVLVVSHMLSTTTVDLLVWTAATLLVVRALRTGDQRLWLAVGAVAGVGLLNKTLVVFLLAALAVGLAVAGPRGVFRSGWLWAGGALALVLWAPNLWWQATHGWPQLDLSSAIAAGGSGTSMPRWAFVPFQLLLIGPALAPIWLVGLVRLLREPALRWARCLAVAYLFLLVVFLTTGGKPYYLGGLYPVLLAAGAPPIVAWARRRGGALRTAVTTLGISGATAAVLMLPLLPAAWLHLTPVTDVNYDAGETVGWPAFAATIARVHDALPPQERAGAIVLVRNYGEAGAVERFGPALGLPDTYSGHNAYHAWGPPPPDAGTVIAVGMDEERLRAMFDSVEPAARIDNGVDLDNDEQGRTVWVCRGLRGTWAQEWPGLRRLG